MLNTKKFALLCSLLTANATAVVSFKSITAIIGGFALYLQGCDNVPKVTTTTTTTTCHKPPEYNCNATPPLTSFNVTEGNWVTIEYNLNDYVHANHTQGQFELKMAEYNSLVEYDKSICFSLNRLDVILQMIYVAHSGEEYMEHAGHRVESLCSTQYNASSIDVIKIYYADYYPCAIQIIDHKVCIFLANGLHEARQFRKKARHHLPEHNDTILLDKSPCCTDYIMKINAEDHTKNAKRAPQYA